MFLIAECHEASCVAMWIWKLRFWKGSCDVHLRKAVAIDLMTKLKMIFTWIEDSSSATTFTFISILFPLFLYYSLISQCLLMRELVTSSSNSQSRTDIKQQCELALIDKKTWTSTSTQGSPMNKYSAIQRSMQQSLPDLSILLILLWPGWTCFPPILITLYILTCDVCWHVQTWSLELYVFHFLLQGWVRWRYRRHLEQVPTLQYKEGKRLPTLAPFTFTICVSPRPAFSSSGLCARNARAEALEISKSIDIYKRFPSTCEGTAAKTPHLATISHHRKPAWDR